jgi:uncharacterized protein YceH (UPF0502 family)
MDLDAVELRVLGCLIEKQRTTPDQYPLSLNALRLASNQATNRDPVVDLDEVTIRAALDRLGHRGWTRLASGPGSRVAKFRHLLDDALQLTPSQLALLAVLMLRGPQTLGELRNRSSRLYPFASTNDVESTLAALADRELVARQPKRPGEREERWSQLLGTDTTPSARPAFANQAEQDWETWPEALVAERGVVFWKTLVNGEGLTLGFARLPPGESLHSHRHEQAEVYFVVEGEGRVTVGGNVRSVGPGAAVFIPGQAVHSFENTGSTDVRFAYVLAADAFADVEYRFEN